MQHCNTIQSTYYAALHPPPALARSASTAAGWRTWILLLYCSAFAADTQTYTLHGQNKSNLKTIHAHALLNSSSSQRHSKAGVFMDTMDSQDGLKTIALPLFLNIFFYFLLQLLCVMISHWLTVLKHKMPRQILIKNAGLVW